MPLFTGIYPAEQLRPVIAELLKMAEQSGLTGRLPVEAEDAEEPAEPAPPEQPAEAAVAEAPPEPTAEEAASQQVVLRLQGGETLEVGAFASTAEASACAQEVVRQHDGVLLVTNTSYDADLEDREIRELMSRDIDGVLYAAVPNMAATGKPPHERFHFAHVHGFVRDTFDLTARRAGSSDLR